MIDPGIDEILTAAFRRHMGYCPIHDPHEASFHGLPPRDAGEVRGVHVAKMVEEGLAKEEIADRLRCAQDTIRRDLIKLGLSAPSRMQKAILDRRGRVKALHAEGMIASEIARHIGADYKAIAKDMEAMGLPRNGRKGRRK